MLISGKYGFITTLFIQRMIMAKVCNATATSPIFDDFETYLVEYIGNSRNLALLLDYDGTLTPIVAHPDLAKIPPETRSILKSLSSKPGIFLTIVSGRNVENVKEMVINEIPSIRSGHFKTAHYTDFLNGKRHEQVGIDEITYAGNHGLEVSYPDGTTYVHQLPKEFEDSVKNLINELEKTVVRDGAWIENKGASLTFHYRSTPENLRPEIEKTARELIEKANFKVGNAHCALEAKPKVDWNKGKVSLLILEKQFGKNWAETTKVIFAGDDTTDEDAMEALKGKAATFRIAQDPTIKTHAVKLLSSTKSVVEILKLVQKIYND